MSRLLSVVCGLCLGLFASGAMSQTRSYVSTNGDQYLERTNSSGIVLRSVEPIERNNVDGTQLTSGIETIYLGKDCDTFHEVFGLGIWRWSNGGFVVEFPEFSLNFPLQELSVAYPKCAL